MADALASPIAAAARSGSERPDAALGEAFFYWFLVLTPLWWATGLLAPLAVFGTVFLFLRRPPRDPFVFAVAIAWMLVGAAQAVSGLVAWATQDQTLAQLPLRLVSMPVTGWVLLGAALGVGAEYRLVSPRIVRAICLYGGLILLFGILAIAAVLWTGRADLEVRSLLGRILPLSPEDLQQQFTLRFARIDEGFLHEGGVPRLILFFPWSTGLAMAGMTTAAVALMERAPRWRLLGLAGGLFGLVFSLSRAAFVATAVAALLLLMLRLETRLRLAVVAAGAFLLNLAVAFGIDPLRLLRETMAIFTAARAGSSEAREWIYEASWRGFLEAPVLGHGQLGPLLDPHVPVPIGSHSTFFGTLYTGGIVTFGAVVVAYLATLATLLRAARGGTYLAAMALSLWVAFGMLCYGEAMYSLVPECLVMFLCFGAGMAKEPSSAHP